MISRKAKWTLATGFAGSANSPTGIASRTACRKTPLPTLSDDLLAGWGYTPQKTMRRHRAKKPPESVGWGNETLPHHERLLPQRSQRSRREFQEGPSEASIPIQPRLIPRINVADVNLILLGRVSLLRILLSVISGHPKGRSVVPGSSCLPESSPRLSAPARPCGRGRLAQFSLLQRFAVWWVALPWPILPVPAVLLALCRVVAKKESKRRFERNRFAVGKTANSLVSPRPQQLTPLPCGGPA